MRRVGIIGGGAAGMIAAIFSARNGNEVHIFEKNAKLGKKIYITGKGRCNITNNKPPKKLLSFYDKKNFLKHSFFAFTNDVCWVKEHYQQKNLTVVEGNDEDAGYIDMYLMTKCKHYILANSSFSWWGCYLNPSENKKVIAPKKWANGKDYRDIYWDGMLVI